MDSIGSQDTTSDLTWIHRRLAHTLIPREEHVAYRVTTVLSDREHDNLWRCIHVECLLVVRAVRGVVVDGSGLQYTHVESGATWTGSSIAAHSPSTVTMLLHGYHIVGVYIWSPAPSSLQYEYYWYSRS